MHLPQGRVHWSFGTQGDLAWPQSNPHHLLLRAPKIKMYFVNTYLQHLQHVYDLNYSSVQLQNYLQH